MTWYDPGPVRPRDVADNPRCPVCKSDDPRGRAPMFHPAHRWGPCQVQLPGQEVCGCTHSERERDRAFTETLHKQAR
jgi:hypothetical protein